MTNFVEKKNLKQVIGHHNKFYDVTELPVQFRFGNVVFLEFPVVHAERCKTVGHIESQQTRLDFSFLLSINHIDS